MKTYARVALDQEVPCNACGELASDGATCTVGRPGHPGGRYVFTCSSCIRWLGEAVRPGNAQTKVYADGELPGDFMQAETPR